MVLQSFRLIVLLMIIVFRFVLLGMRSLCTNVVLVIPLSILHFMTCVCETVWSLGGAAAPFSSILEHVHPRRDSSCFCAPLLHVLWHVGPLPW